MKKKKKFEKKFLKKKNLKILKKIFWIFFYIKGSGVREGKKPEVRNPDISKFAGLPNRMWCPVEPYLPYIPCAHRLACLNDNTGTIKINKLSLFSSF